MPAHDLGLFHSKPIWLKPLKFAFALSVYLLSLAFFARVLSQRFLGRRSYRVFIVVVIRGVPVFPA